MSVIPFSLLMNADIEKISMKVDLAEERDGVVKYRVRVVLDSNEYIIYREYKQFKAFYKSLRTKFTRLEFSDFPSKFAVFNKKEQRRKGFDSFLRNLLEIGGNFASLAQSTLKRLLCDFLIEGKPGVITETDEIVEGEQVKANLGSMMGFVDIKFDDEDWISYYASLIKSDIYFFANDNDSYFTMMINCSGAEISESDFEDVLEIHHLHEKRPILIRAKNWLDWKHALVVVSGYAVASKYHKNKSNGRLVIRIYSGQNIRLMKPAVSIVKPHVFVKITLDSLEYQTSIMPQEYLVNWNQTFILPMVNRFFVLKVAVCRFSSDGWLKQHRKDDVLEEFSIPLVDINQYPYTKGPVTINLSKVAGKKKEADDGEQPCINLDVVHEAAFVGNFISPPSAFIEDNGKPERATLDDFRLISKRLKRIRIVYLMFFRTVDCIFTWMYPKISAISMMIYTLLGIFLPSQLAFPLIILIVTVFCITMSPSCANFRKSLEKNFFSEKNRIKSFPQICTIKESEFKIKKEFANFKEKDKDGVLNTIKKIRIDLDELVIILLDIVSFTEKMRNLFLWEDPQKSLYFCCGLTILIYLLYSIPFRLLLLVIGLLKFLTGRKKTLKMLKNNCQLCQEVLDSLFSKYLPDFFLKVTQEKPWSQELINNITLQKKFVEKIRAQLDLDIDITIFQRYSSPKLLHEALSSCETTLKLRDRDGHIAEKSNKQSQNFLAGFLSNIPSEYYRFQHPRLTNLYAAN